MLFLRRPSVTHHRHQLTAACARLSSAVGANPQPPSPPPQSPSSTLPLSSSHSEAVLLNVPSLRLCRFLSPLISRRAAV